jgi:hypothetical protein
MSALGHFRPIQPVLPAGLCPPRPGSGHEAGLEAGPDLIEIGHHPVIQASKLVASNHAL